MFFLGKGQNKKVMKNGWKKNERAFALLMPISALPSEEGIGVLGDCSKQFIDYVKRCGASVWQVLPLLPTNYGDSPYQSCSSDALNYYFINLRALVKEGLLTPTELSQTTLFRSPRRVDYGLLFTEKVALLRRAFSRFEKKSPAFQAFLARGEYDDFALFMALKVKFHYEPWMKWREPYRTYDGRVIEQFQAQGKEEIAFWQFTQFTFERQWTEVRAYAKAKGVQIMGDIPLYLAQDSVEVWKYGEKLFQVDKNRRPIAVAGVPPDAFSDEGQLWGNPLYDWERMKEDGYAWWNERLKKSLKLYDILRIDHFRAFDRYYAVPATAKNAQKGEWRNGPKETLFSDKKQWNIVAEDLGVMDEGVRSLMKKVGYLGMKILQFAFDGNQDNEHKPSNFTQNFVCYTGTHDNMPLMGVLSSLNEGEKKILCADLRAECKQLRLSARCQSQAEICHSIVRLGFASRAKLFILPMWDALSLGEEARINLPATVSPNNWSFRFLQGELSEVLAKKLKNLARTFHRT